eukprot:363994-Chlamydomonas_euryale.AAC.1
MDNACGAWCGTWHTKGPHGHDGKTRVAHCMELCMCISVPHAAMHACACRWRVFDAGLIAGIAAVVVSAMPCDLSAVVDIVAVAVPGVIVVVFEGSHLTESRELIQDRIMLQSEAGEVEVQLKALAPAVGVDVHGDLNFGIVPVDSKATKQLTLVNHGAAPAGFKFESSLSLGGKGAGPGAQSGVKGCVPCLMGRLLGVCGTVRVCAVQ